MPLIIVAKATAAPKVKDQKLSDEDGLLLSVKRAGAKYWRMKYRPLAGRS